MNSLNRTDGGGKRTARAGARVLAGLLACASAAAADICPGLSGPALIQCIEASARKGGEKPPVTAPATAAPAAAPVPPAPARPSAQPAEDCTGREGEVLRRCLAAGGRLSAQAARPGLLQPSSDTVPASCDNLTGEALRACVQAQGKAAPPGPRTLGILDCPLYHPADQQLCYHRNLALIECAKRLKYPDPGVCMRSMMANAPTPGPADCTKLAGAARNQCDARNRVLPACRADRTAYFDCLDQKLGADAVLRR